MDHKEAKKLLRQHTTALQKILGDDIKSEAIKQAAVAKGAKKTLLGRIKELPVVEKVTSLGTAGTVAVGTAGVTQADLAINYTEVVVAQVAEDVYKGIIEPPFLFDMIDYEALHIWGQQVIADKVAEVSELQSTSEPSAESTDPKPTPASSSQGTDDGKPSQSTPTESNQESKSEKSETKESKSSKTNEGEGKTDKPAEPQQEKAEELKETQENNTSEESKTAELPIVNTPIDSFDDVKPHNLVSPVN